MKITFLGTSSGMPTRQRNVTAIALTPADGKRWYLVDCGEATQHQLLHTHLSLLYLNTIMITHIHGDHCYGLPGLLASAATCGRTEVLTIIAPKGIQEFIEAVCRNTALVLPYPLQFLPVETLNTPYELPDFDLGIIPLSHRVPSFAYEFRQRHAPSLLDIDKLHALELPPGPLWGQLKNGENVQLKNGQTLLAKDYLIPVKPKRVIIGGDNDKPELLAERAQHADVLVHEATYTAAVAEQVGSSAGHSSAASVAQFAELIQLPNLILTHFSARYHHSLNAKLDDVRNEAKQFYRGNLFFADDFSVYELAANGIVKFAGSALTRNDED
jgi:ribonuclease Z